MLRRDQILRTFIKLAREAGGNSPSTRAVAHKLKLSPSTVQSHLLKLELEGLLERKSGKLTVAGSTWDALPPTVQRPTRRAAALKGHDTRRKNLR